MLIGYARVSTPDQYLRMQEDALFSSRLIILITSVSHFYKKGDYKMQQKKRECFLRIVSINLVFMTSMTYAANPASKEYVDQQASILQNTATSLQNQINNTLSVLSTKRCTQYYPCGSPSRWQLFWRWSGLLCEHRCQCACRSEGVNCCTNRCIKLNDYGMAKRRVNYGNTNPTKNLFYRRDKYKYHLVDNRYFSCS